MTSETPVKSLWTVDTEIIWSVTSTHAHSAIKSTNLPQWWSKISSTIVKCKRICEQNLVNKSRKEPKLLYTYIRSKSSNKKTISTLIDSHGTTAEDDASKAEVLNEYIATVFNTKEEDKGGGEWSNAQQEYPTMSQVFFTPELVTKYIRKLNPTPVQDQT